MAALAKDEGGGGDAVVSYAFDLGQSTAWKKHLEEQGFVVLRKCLDDQEVQASRGLLYRDIKRLWKLGEEQELKWTSLRKGPSHGLLSSLAQSAGAWRVRSSARVQDAFAHIWDCTRDDLITSMDCCILWTAFGEGSANMRPRTVRERRLTLVVRGEEEGAQRGRACSTFLLWDLVVLALLCSVLCSGSALLSVHRWRCKLVALLLLAALSLFPCSLLLSLPGSLSRSLARPPEPPPSRRSLLTAGPTRTAGGNASRPKPVLQAQPRGRAGHGPAL